MPFSLVFPLHPFLPYLTVEATILFYFLKCIHGIGRYHAMLLLRPTEAYTTNFLTRERLYGLNGKHATVSDARERYKAKIAKAGLTIESFDGHTLTLTYRPSEDTAFSGNGGDSSQSIRFAAMNLPKDATAFPGVRRLVVSLLTEN